MDNIRLDGRCLFQIAFPKSNLSERITEIQSRVNQIKIQYLSRDNPELEITQERRANSQYVYVNLGNNPILLLTVTSEDAALDGVTIETKAEQIARQVENGLEIAQQERQTNDIFIYSITKIHKSPCSFFQPSISCSVHSYRQ